MLTANHYKLTPTEELEIQAKEKLDPLVYDFIAGGAGSEWGLKNNRDAFRKYTIVPRVRSGRNLGKKVSNLSPPLNHIQYLPCFYPCSNEMHQND